MDWNEIWQSILNWLTTSGVKLVIGLVALFIIFKIINLISKKVRKNLEKRSTDKTIARVVYRALSIVLKVVVFVAFLGFIGIDTAGIGTIIASAGLAIGLALQGSLANFAGGILILIIRPFNVGDYIEAQGISGTVEDMHLFYTTVITPDNKQITLPNGTLSNDKIINYSKKNIRGVEYDFNISYDSDYDKAIKIIRDVTDSNELILKTPEPLIKMSEHGSNSIKIKTRIWTKTEDYWTVYFKLLEDVKKKFDSEGIKIPYNQLDVHLDSDKSGDFAKTQNDKK